MKPYSIIGSGLISNGNGPPGVRSIQDDQTALGPGGNDVDFYGTGHGQSLTNLSIADNMINPNKPMPNTPDV